jgi:CxxC-x17-CxxC domain-containing protein
MEQYRDEHIVCADCGASFVFSAAEAGVFAERGLTAPKRCKECRRARKQRTAAEGGRPPEDAGRWGGQSPPAHDSRGPRGAPSYGGHDARRAPPRYTGDVNEYRSPMTDGGYPWRGPDAGPPRRPPTRNAGPPPYGGGDYRSQPAPQPAPYRGQRPMGNGAPHRSDDYRSPMPDRGYPRPGGPSNGNRPRNGEGFAAVHDGGHDRGHDGGPAPRSPRGERPFRDEGERRPQGHAGPPHAGPPHAGPPGFAPRRPAAEMFQITCDSCGNQAEVPFRPAEGREVYCQPCYRARKPQ